MLENLSGGTSLLPIIGDPIAQVKSPKGVTLEFGRRGADIICIPMHVSVADFAAVMASLRHIRNCVGVIITVPHKFAAASQCDRLSDRARFLGSVNTIRREANGDWHGDMFDGLGFVDACRDKGCAFEGKRALLVGAGGAGTAIALATAQSGVAALDICDTDAGRRNNLAQRLRAEGLPARAIASPDGKYNILLNATPLGMRASDPLPVAEALIDRDVFVGDVVTQPEEPPLIALARSRGARVSNGVTMFGKVRNLMIDFLTATETP